MWSKIELFYLYLSSSLHSLSSTLSFLPLYTLSSTLISSSDLRSNQRPRRHSKRKIHHYFLRQKVINRNWNHYRNAKRRYASQSHQILLPLGTISFIVHSPKYHRSLRQFVNISNNNFSAHGQIPLLLHRILVWLIFSRRRTQ